MCGLSRLCMTVIAMVLGFAVAHAAEADLGEIELGKTYSIPSFGKVTGTFTAPATGTLKQVGSGDPSLYTDEGYTREVKKTFAGYESGGAANTYQVTEGTKYYIYCNFNMNGSSVTWYMDGVGGGEQAIEIDFCTPEEGKAMNFANYENIDMQFNQAVECATNATLMWGNGTTASVKTTVYNSNKNILVPVYATFKPLLEAGTVKPGDVFIMTVKDVRAKGKAAGSGKDFTKSFKLGSIPAVRVSEYVPDPFLSYWAPGDKNGIYQITFNTEVAIGEQTRMQFGWGNLESENQEYYYEELVPTLSEDKKTIYVDFTGKVRTAKTMTPNYPDAVYDNCSLKLVGVVDAHGNPVKSEGQGTIGSYSYAPVFKELSKVNVVSEFTPANGTSLNGVDNLEIWLKPANQISFTGFSFSYKDGSEMKNAVVAKADATVKADEADGSETWTVPVPAEVKGKKDITVTLADFSCTDGFNHDNDVKASYDTFVILTCDPAAGSEMATLTKGTVLAITTNYDALYPQMYITYEIEDMNPVNEDQRIIKSESWLTRQSDGSYKTEVYGNYKLVSGHTYHVNFTAWEKESDSHSMSTASPLGTAYVEWFGATPPYVYSSDELLKITPAEGTVLSVNDRVFTVEFSGMVNISKETSYINLGFGSNQPFESIVPTEPEDIDGVQYSNIWTLTVSESFMKSLTSQLEFCIVATDMQGRRVKGNLGEEDNTYFYYSYDTENQFSSDFTVEVVGEAPVTAVKQFKVSSERGINISYTVPLTSAIVVSKLQETVASVESFELAEGELGQKTTSLTLTLDKEIAAAGDYMLIIPQSYFTIDEEFAAQNSAARNFEFSVAESGSSQKLNLAITPAEGEVTELESIEIIFSDYQEISLGSGVPTLTVNNAEPVKLADAALDFDIWNMATQSLGQKYTEPGEYVITYPAGYFNLGTDGKTSPEIKISYTIVAEKKLNLTVTPAETDKITELEKVEILFNDYSEIAIGSGAPTLTINNAEPVKLNDAELDWDVWNKATQSLGQKYTEPGQYVISYPAGYFTLGSAGEAAPAFKFTYKIGESGVESIVVDTNGNYNVFNLSGIRVSVTSDKAALRNLTPGIYIVNGVKVIIR